MKACRCESCGAPLNESKCAYCGTTHEDFSLGFGPRSNMTLMVPRRSIKHFDRLYQLDLLEAMAAYRAGI